MPDLGIQDVYVTRKPMKIWGRVYAAGEVVPDADSLPTLHALLVTNQLERRAMAVMVDPETNEVEDLGSSEFSAPSEKPAPRKKRKYTRRKKTKKSTAN